MDGFTKINTNLRPLLIKQSNGDIKFHQRHIQTVPVEELYKNFLDLTEYRDWKIEHAHRNAKLELIYPSIGLRLFNESVVGVCKCVSAS